jgi:hypothetical protein
MSFGPGHKSCAVAVLSNEYLSIEVKHTEFLRAVEASVRHPEHTTALVTAETGFWWREQLKSSSFTVYIINKLLQQHAPPGSLEVTETVGCRTDWCVFAVLCHLHGVWALLSGRLLYTYMVSKPALEPGLRQISKLG